MPDSAEYQVAVGLSKWHMGQLLKSQGAAAQARELLEQAVALEEQAVKADPGNQAAHDHLKGARNHLANCLTDLGEYTESARVVEDLFRAISPARDSNTMMDCASHLAECAFLAPARRKTAPGQPARERFGLRAQGD